MAGITVGKIAEATKKASAGVDYSSRYGALCPWCGKRTKVYKTMPWEDDIRVRYHQCGNVRCALGTMGCSIKSIEVCLSC